jgi:macrodomain Ter protein organizer (MatP/YcbG family)
MHQPYNGSVVSGAYLSYVVHLARHKYNGHAATAANEDLARSHMVREMTAHGMHPGDISDIIEEMVTAVFYQDEKTIRERRKRGSLAFVGAYGGPMGA